MAEETEMTGCISCVAFARDERGAIAVDWTVLTASLTGMGLAVMAVVSGGVENTTNQIRNFLEGVTISASFRDLIGQVCAAQGLEAGPHSGVAGLTYNGMPVTALLIYEAQDFVGGLPSEARAVGGGGGPQTLELRPDAEPIVLFVADDDDQLHEVDETQLVAQDLELNGVTYGEGFDVSAAYTLSDPDSGLTLSALHFGDPFNGTRQGPVFATTATNPLEPGQSYDFSGNITTHRNELGYSDYLGCS